MQGGTWPAASQAAVDNFADTPAGAELIEEWVTRQRASLAMSTGPMPPKNRTAAEEFLDGLSIAGGSRIARNGKMTTIGHCA